MASVSPYVKDLKGLIASDPEAADIPDLERELFASGSDRALAVLYSSLVEVLIKRLLNAKIRSELNSDDRDRLFGPQGPVGTFSSRIIVAYAFGLIGPDTRFNLDLIREIRNVFAHSRKPLSFDTKQVRAACAHLKIPDIWGALTHQLFRQSYICTISCRRIVNLRLTLTIRGLGLFLFATNYHSEWRKEHTAHGRAISHSRRTTRCLDASLRPEHKIYSYCNGQGPNTHSCHAGFGLLHLHG